MTSSHRSGSGWIAHTPAQLPIPSSSRRQKLRASPSWTCHEYDYDGDDFGDDGGDGDDDPWSYSVQT